MRSLCGIFYGIVMTRDDFKSIFETDLDELYNKKKNESMGSVDDFLDDAKGLKSIQDNLFPKGTTLILSSDHYDDCDERVDDMILGIEVKVIDIQRKKGPTSLKLKSSKIKKFREFLLAYSIEEPPAYILRAPV